MVSSGCAAATAFYTLPILACSVYSVLSILSVKLYSGKLFLFTEGKDPNQKDPEASAEQSPEGDPAGWPVWSLEFAQASLGLSLWCLFPVMAYALIRGLGDCEQYGSICWKVEDQTTSSHARNLLHLMTFSILLAWLCKVPPSRRRQCAVFGAVAICELLINKYFWKNCESFLAHSVSSGSTFGAFDLFIALTSLLSLVMMMLEGLPSLHSRLKRLNTKAASDPRNLHLSYRGQRNYLLYWGFIMFFHAVLFMAFSENLHLHHYWGGLVLATFCIFPTPLSRLLLLKGLMMAIDGIGVWGADAIVGEDEGGITESDADIRLILCVLVVLAFTGAVGINIFRDPRCRALCDTKNRALDTE
eukprot:Skav222239  [mRNA]  locus=scaffold3059:99966:101042:- [translate_table: standard]